MSDRTEKGIRIEKPEDIDRLPVVDELYTVPVHESWRSVLGKLMAELASPTPYTSLAHIMAMMGLTMISQIELPERLGFDPVEIVRQAKAMPPQPSVPVFLVVRVIRRDGPSRG